jgi:hypothetical protein
LSQQRPGWIGMVILISEEKNVDQFKVRLLEADAAN